MKLLQTDDVGNLVVELFEIAKNLVGCAETLLLAQYQVGDLVSFNTLRAAVRKYNAVTPSLAVEVIPSLPPKVEFMPAEVFAARQLEQEQQEARRDELGYGHRDD